MLLYRNLITNKKLSFLFDYFYFEVYLRDIGIHFKNKSSFTEKNNFVYYHVDKKIILIKNQFIIINYQICFYKRTCIAGFVIKHIFTALRNKTKIYFYHM